MTIMEIRFDDSLKAYIDEKVEEAVKDIKQGFIVVMISEIMKLQTYKMFPYEEKVYIERDKVLKIFEEFMEGGEENEETDSD